VSASAGQDGNLLEVRDLVASYGGVDVLRGISLTVGRGEFVCVIGANTAGKSTIVRSISRLVPRSTGAIVFDGQDLMRLRSFQVPALGIAHVPEGRQVFPEMTVEENLRLGAFTARRDSGLQERIESVFSLFPRLAERRTQLAGTLSGGEQQMVAVGRALMLKPKLLILDEPSHGLAPKVVEEMHRTFVRIHQEGAAVLLIEQNTAMALEAASRGYVLERGSIVLQGSSADLKSDPNVRAAYLGI
jgi:branched-chain amino acid transport system ATP-binding protein